MISINDTMTQSQARRTTGNQCLFCNSRQCHTRIYTDNMGYDEVACSKHIKELEHHADETLGSHNGVLRWHHSSSGFLTRGVARTK